jgi:hypothetical protein
MEKGGWRWCNIYSEKHGEIRDMQVKEHMKHFIEAQS